MEKACYKFLIVIIIIIIISYFYSEQSSARSAERSDFIILSRAKRVRSLLTARGLGIRQWRHRAFCVSRQHRLRHWWPSHRLWIKVYRRWITNNFPCKWHTSTTSGSIELQILAQEDFPPKLFWSENADFKFSVNNEGLKEETSTRNRGAEGTSLSTARDRGTGDWNQRHYDRSLSKTHPRRYM